MLLWLAEYLQQFSSDFYVFQYLTLRMILSVLTALFLSLFVGSFFIRALSNRNIGQAVRDDGPQSHLPKEGVPTMGGLLILLSVIVGTLCWCRLDNRYVGIVVVVTLLFAIVGGIDDWCKIVKRKGLLARHKLLAQSLIVVGMALFILWSARLPVETELIIPFVKFFSIDLAVMGGVPFIVLAWLVVVGSSNGVNLTDGLDGLAILPAVMVAAALAIFAYVGGHSQFSSYLGIPYVPGVGELSVFCGAIVGAGLGFLWFNTYPAQVFMGDIGSLSLGAALGVVALLTRQELAFFIMGGLFVVEALSVMLQVISYRLTGKRIFRMAPLHHHFELKGWPEPQVVVRFWIVTLILVLIGLASLKIR